MSMGKLIEIDETFYDSLEEDNADELVPFYNGEKNLIDIRKKYNAPKMKKSKKRRNILAKAPKKSYVEIHRARLQPLKCSETPNSPPTLRPVQSDLDLEIALVQQTENQSDCESSDVDFQKNQTEQQSSIEVISPVINNATKNGDKKNYSKGELAKRRIAYGNRVSALNKAQKI